MSDNKKQMLKKYADLSKKLGKLATLKQVNKLIYSERQVYNEFENFKELKEEALKEYEFLKELTSPVEITVSEIENYRVDLENKDSKKGQQKLVKNVSTLEYISRFAENVFKGKVTSSPYKGRKEYTRRYLNLVLSDLHFGADIDSSETGGLKYSKIEESRRFAKIIQETCRYKTDHRSETELNVFLLGDIIQGMLGHDARDGAELAEQFCRGVHILLQGLAVLSSQFKTVNVHCSTGNHDRNIARHAGRAVHSKYDSYATMLYYSLLKGCSELKNVKFNIPKTPYVIAEVFDKKIFAWHGDTGLKTGNIGRTINTNNIEHGINRINASVLDKDEYSAFVCGHLHTGSVTFLSNGAVLLVNGGLPPTDSYGISLGIHESNCGQMLFESVPGLAVGDIRFIRVNENVDKDTTLDNIIKSWEGYNV